MYVRTCLNHAHQLADSLVVCWQRSQNVDLRSFKEVAFKGCGLDLECALTLGELFEQTGSCTGMFVREGDKSRTYKDVVQAHKIGTFNSATHQRVTYNSYVHTSFTRIFTQTSHSSNAHAAGISHNSGERTFGSFVDFSDDGFLVFELNCHGFYSWIYH